MYLYGIEIHFRWRKSIFCTRFNCTFMELKFCLENCVIDTDNRFNCTFMELKCNLDELQALGWCVLIVPLWNWNGTFAMIRGSSNCFNCTFMELKLLVRQHSSQINSRFNCTFMELKLRDRPEHQARKKF